MDTHIKEGQLYVQHHKFGKKWKKNWFVLYPASQNGIARLEFYDCSGGGASDKPNTKKLYKKIIRLSECISILPALTEALPKDNMSSFCVETNDKSHVFAAERNVSTEWVEKMCEIAFGGGSGSSTSVFDSNRGQTDLQMAENLIYYTREEVNEFWVSVQRTEASELCGLLGTYWLKADNDSLILKESKTKSSLLVWPYKLLRRYGRDRVMFSFEAGRRCESGPGNFTFETKQGNEIFLIVEQAIQSQKALAEERHPMSRLESDPGLALMQLRIAMASGSGGGLVVEGNCSNRDPDGDSSSEGSKPGSADEVFGEREGDGGNSQGQNHKGRSLPEPPPLVIGVGGTSPRSPMLREGKGEGAPRSQEEQGSVYSEPAESVCLPPLSPGDCLYSDPVDAIKTQTPNPLNLPPITTSRLRPLCDEGGVTGVWGRNHSNNQPEPLYSDLYDRVSMDLIQRTGALGLEGGGRGGGSEGRGGWGNMYSLGGQAEASSSLTDNEHIYDEPVGRAGGGAISGIGMGAGGAMTLSVWRNNGGDNPPPQPHEGLYNKTKEWYAVPSYGKQPQPQPPPVIRGPAGAKWPPKLVTAPKLNKAALPRKEPVPLPLGKAGPGGPTYLNKNNSS
uniref:Docking protein 1b n=1 Tax=Hucho hucho TaxID=62062 RepID=A0A4W5PDL6_9TELE